MLQILRSKYLIDDSLSSRCKCIFNSASKKLSNQTNYAFNRALSVENNLVTNLYEGLKSGDRSSLARSITLIENTLPSKQTQAYQLMRLILENNKVLSQNAVFSKSFRIGITGPPGAGKSTHIESLGKLLTKKGHKVAVLTVDPSSSRTGGSIMADKTRMLELAVDENAYIRSSPSSGNLGGVTRVTNNTIVLCEAAGYDIIIVETVGVGQSEYAVADMVDMFELLLPPAGGDDLQGIKRGIMEMADIIVINKSDGDLVPAARRIQAEYVGAVKILRPKTDLWKPCVMRVSSLTKEGMENLWLKMEEFRQKLDAGGELQLQRRQQHVKWMHSHLNQAILAAFKQHNSVKELINKMEDKVENGEIIPSEASDIILRSLIEQMPSNFPLNFSIH